MSHFGDLQENTGQEGQREESETVRSEEGCCLPFFPRCGPDTCGLPVTGERGAEQVGHPTPPREKIVKLTRAGAQRLFNGEDDQIYSRDDLLEVRPDGSLKVTGGCTGAVWLVQKEEIAAIEDLL